MKFEELLIHDEEFNECLQSKVLPWVQAFLQEDYFESYDGKKLHYVYAINKEEKASIVMSHGYCEFAPKFYEVMYYFYNMGYSVFFVEHRGHGFSDRMVMPLDKVHIDHFQRYVDDFDAFVRKIVMEKSITKRYIGWAHSMGGAIMTVYIEQHTDVFERVILSSPMHQMGTKGAPMWQVKLVKLMSYIPGLGTMYIPGQGGYDHVYKQEKSSAMCKPRYDFGFNYRENEVHYQTYGGTICWMRESLNISKKIIKNAKNITIPVILFQAGQDTLVEPEGQNAFCDACATATKIVVEGCKHEIYNSYDSYLIDYYQRIFEFIEQVV